MRAVAFFHVGDAAVASNSLRLKLLGAMLAALDSVLLIPSLLGPNLFHKLAETLFQEALVCVPEVHCAALCLQSET